MKEEKELNVKFAGIEDFTEISKIKLSNPSPGKFEDLAVIYAVSWDTNYVKLLKRSIVSQIKYTDINLEHVYVVCDYTTVETVKEELDDIIDEKNIITVPNNFSIKVTALSHYRFDNYNAKLMFDADLFVYSQNGRYNFYEKMSEYYKYYDTLLFWMEYNWASHELVDRSLTLNGLLHYGETFLKFYLNNLSEAQYYRFHDGLKWRFTGFLGVKNHFKEPEYFKYLFNSLVNAVGCDETILNIWTEKMEYKTSFVHYLPHVYMQSSIDIIQFIDDYKNKKLLDDSFYLIHPIERKLENRTEIIDFINDLIK